jgi:hypothetical protein
LNTIIINYVKKTEAEIEALFATKFNACLIGLYFNAYAYLMGND